MHCQVLTRIYNTSTWYFVDNISNNGCGSHTKLNIKGCIHQSRILTLDDNMPCGRKNAGGTERSWGRDGKPHPPTAAVLLCSHLARGIGAERSINHRLAVLRMNQWVRASTAMLGVFFVEIQTGWTGCKKYLSHPMAEQAASQFFSCTQDFSLHGLSYKKRTWKNKYPPAFWGSATDCSMSINLSGNIITYIHLIWNKTVLIFSYFKWYTACGCCVRVVI